MNLLAFVTLSMLVAIASTQLYPSYQRYQRYCYDRFGYRYPVDYIMNFKCRNGYELVGKSQIHCMNNGQWSDYFSRCERVQQKTYCPDPHGGSKQYNIGYKFRFANCRKGTVLVGNKSVTCGSNGEWNGQFPTCITQAPITSCADPGIPAAGKRISHFNVDKLEIGAQMEFSCEQGYRRRGNREITCKPNGQWSAPAPTCRVITS